MREKNFWSDAIAVRCAAPAIRRMTVVPADTQESSISLGHSYVADDGRAKGLHHDELNSCSLDVLSLGACATTPASHPAPAPNEQGSGAYYDIAARGPDSPVSDGERVYSDAFNQMIALTTPLVDDVFPSTPTPAQ